MFVNALENRIEAKRRLDPTAMRNAATLATHENSPHLYEGHRLLPQLVTNVAAAIYFGVFPLLLIGAAVVFAFGRDLQRLRVFSIALVADYAISLPIYLAVPLPERWYYAGSGATLIADPLFVRLLRPLSGLTHCYPSFHTSAAVAIVAICFVYQQQFRWTSAVVALLVMESTLLLGIHWFVDVVAGIGVGLMSVSIAIHVEQRLQRQRWREREAPVAA